MCNYDKFLGERITRRGLVKLSSLSFLGITTSMTRALVMTVQELLKK